LASEVSFILVADVGGGTENGTGGRRVPFAFASAHAMLDAGLTVWVMGATVHYGLSWSRYELAAGRQNCPVDKPADKPVESRRNLRRTLWSGWATAASHRRTLTIDQQRRNSQGVGNKK